MCFTPEQRAPLIPKLSLAADVTDDALLSALIADYAATEPAITALSAAKTAAEGNLDAMTETVAEGNRQIAALSAAKDAAEARVLELTAAVEAKEAKVLELSAVAGRDIDPMALALVTRSFKVDREQVIASGVISEAGMNEIDALMEVGNPRGVALSLSAGGTDPRYSRLCEIIRRNPGFKLSNSVTREATVAVPPRYPNLPPLSGAGQPPQKDTEEAPPDLAHINQLRAERGLAPLDKLRTAAVA